MLKINELLNECKLNDADTSSVISSYKSLLSHYSDIRINKGISPIFDGVYMHDVDANIDKFLKCNECDITYRYIRCYCSICNAFGIYGLAVFIYCMIYQVDMRYPKQFNEVIQEYTNSLMNDNYISFIQFIKDISSILDNTPVMRYDFDSVERELLSEVSHSCYLRFCDFID